MAILSPMTRRDSLGIEIRISPNGNVWQASTNPDFFSSAGEFSVSISLKVALDYLDLALAACAPASAGRDQVDAGLFESAGDAVVFAQLDDFVGC